jgi:hypothetical protein
LLVGFVSGARKPTRRKEAYRQMALIINDGLTGAGNIVELPKYVLSGIRSMFPGAD